MCNHLEGSPNKRRTPQNDISKRPFHMTSAWGPACPAFQPFNQAANTRSTDSGHPGLLAFSPVSRTCSRRVQNALRARSANSFQSIACRGGGKGLPRDQDRMLKPDSKKWGICSQRGTPPHYALLQASTRQVAESCTTNTPSPYGRTCDPLAGCYWGRSWCQAGSYLRKRQTSAEPHGALLPSQ